MARALQKHVARRQDQTFADRFAELRELAGERWADVADQAPTVYAVFEHLVRVGPVPPTPGRLAFHIPMRPSPHRFDRSQIRPPTRRALQAEYDHLSRQLQLTLLRDPAVRLANTIIVVQSIRPREPRRFCELAPGLLPAPFCDIAVVDLTFYFAPSIFDNSTDIDNFSYNSQQLSKIIYLW